MEHDPAPEVAPEVPEDGASQSQAYGLTRRDFLKASAISIASTLLLLSRCYQLPESGPFVIPPDFKRFILYEPSPKKETEKIAVALGSQCPDRQCVLWWIDDQEFQFFESVEQIIELYGPDGQAELVWLD